jgi:hypothetical protein
MQLLFYLVVFRLKSNSNKMKKVIVFGFILAFAITAYSQEREYQTLVDFNDARISGMISPFMQFTSINGEFAHMMGGGGALLIGDFFFGGYGIGLTNSIPATKVTTPTVHNMSVGHGGFWLGYSLFGERPIHVTFSSLVGWGTISLREEYYSGTILPDNIFVVVPTIEVELNLTRFFRLGVGATYNIYSFVDMEGYSNSDFSSPGGFLAFKLGWF